MYLLDDFFKSFFMWKTNILIILNFAYLCIEPEVSARITHQRYFTSGISSRRSIDETTRNFFCRSHKYRRLFRHNEGDRERGRGHRRGIGTLMRGYDNAPIYGIMYIGSCMIIWRDKAALSRHKLNRFSLSLFFPSRPSLLISFSTHPLPLWSSEETPIAERDTLAALWYRAVRKRLSFTHFSLIASLYKHFHRRPWSIKVLHQQNLS